ncbi:hypothetical protein DFH09DRAFT_1086441 [Mycena vulgaris]|nr:hypothetical protein DFH09DRAFT_1086441 [Mycena vulgaris]
MAALRNSILFIQKYGAESNDALRLDRYESVRSFQESDRVPILLHFRSVPRLKPLGSAITSVFVSTFAMLSVLWTIFNFIAGALAGSQSDKFSFKLSRWAVNFADIEEQGGPQDRHCCHSAIKVALEVEDREPLTPSKLQANQMESTRLKRAGLSVHGAWVGSSAEVPAQSQHGWMVIPNATGSPETGNKSWDEGLKISVGQKWQYWRKICHQDVQGWDVTGNTNLGIHRIKQEVPRWALVSPYIVWARQWNYQMDVQGLSSYPSDGGQKRNAPARNESPTSPIDKICGLKPPVGCCSICGIRLLKGRGGNSGTVKMPGEYRGIWAAECVPLRVARKAASKMNKQQSSPVSIRRSVGTAADYFCVGCAYSGLTASGWESLGIAQHARQLTMKCDADFQDDLSAKYPGRESWGRECQPWRVILHRCPLNIIFYLNTPPMYGGE